MSDRVPIAPAGPEIQKLPKDLLGRTPDGIIAGAKNPFTGANDLEVAVAGDRLRMLARMLVDGRRDAEDIKTTLTQPESVFETTDLDLLYYRRSDRRSRSIFFVRVRPTGLRAFAWDFEPFDPEDPITPASKSSDRTKRRLL